MNILWLLFSLFFGISFFGFGSGFAILPVIYQTVSDYGFLTPEEFSHMIAISQALPGPVMANAVSYTGFMTAGVPGAAVSVAAVVLPSLILVSLVMKFLDRYRNSVSINSVLAGIRPVAIGLIGAAAVMISENTLYFGRVLSEAWAEKGLAYLDPVPCLICAVVTILMLKTKISPFILIIISVIAGALLIR
jgi:chromate transporter